MFSRLIPIINTIEVFSEWNTSNEQNFNVRLFYLDTEEYDCTSVDAAYISNLGGVRMKSNVVLGRSRG